MIFAKLAFSIKVRKLLDFAYIFGGKNEEINSKFESKNVLFLSIEFEGLFL